jgi:ribosomal protein S18 acetylase RimI-like enzyme
VWRYFTRPYHAATRRYVRWLITRARHEVPFTPPAIPHFHFNILPEARTVGTTRAMVDMLFRHLIACGETQVYGQVVAYETRRGARMFERYGFRVIDEREVTKYRDLDPRKIYLFTILKDLGLNPSLYGLDLRKEKYERAA